MCLGEHAVTRSCHATAVIVGAAGNGSLAAAVYAYQYYRDEEGNLGTTLYCTVKHKNPMADSKMGFSLAQASNGADTIVLAGAPGENLVYAILLRPVEGKCSVMNVLAPMLSDMSVSDMFGHSVAFVEQFVVIGSPGYNRYFKPEVDGLLFSAAFCFPGYTPQPSMLAGTDEFYDVCRLCGPSQTSEGGRAEACTPCQVTIPPNSVLNYGCSFKCLEGFFGDKCQKCSEYNANAYKPENSHWKDGAPECKWECDGGYKTATYENGTDYCIACAERWLYQRWKNVEWVVGKDDCSWKCQRGFFLDEARPQETQCFLCSELTSSRTNPPPVNAEWMDGLDTCVWGPKKGHICTGNGPDDSCAECPLIPLNSRLIDDKPTYALSRCNYACSDGFFGHPVYKDVCKRCPAFMEEVVKASLPKNAFWLDSNSLQTCTTDSWACSKGLNRSNLTAYCCPPPGTVPNTHPDPTYSPCQYACDLSYRWNGDTASCDPCGFTRSNSTWLLDCQYKCNPYYFGREELDMCVPCSEYRTRAKTPVPPNAYFPYNSVSASKSQPVNVCTSLWMCAETFDLGVQNGTRKNYTCHLKSFKASSKF
jgi:hypothetical protein